MNTAEKQTLEILYSNKELLIINKPPFMPVYPPYTSLVSRGSSLVKKTITVSECLMAKYPELKSIGPPGEMGLIHRLDNNTSGILVAARTEESYLSLKKIWNTPVVQKTYLALVVGNLLEKNELTTWIAHHPRKKKKMMVCAPLACAKQFKAREAKTSIIPVKHYLFNFKYPYTLLKIKIETGIRHQIRVTLASLGYPIAGDQLYQNSKKRAEDPLPHKRYFLHLNKVELCDPQTGKIRTFDCPLADDLMKLKATF